MKLVGSEDNLQYNKKFSATSRICNKLAEVCRGIWSRYQVSRVEDELCR